MTKVVTTGPGFVGRAWAITFACTREIWACDYEAATCATNNRRVFSSFPKVGLKGLLDRATVDADGFVWSVSVYGGQTCPLPPRRQARSRRRPADRKLYQPEFWGPQSRRRLRELDGMRGKGAKPREREAGGLFAVYGLGVPDLPEPQFAG